jgi:hypothetical protein
VCSVRVEIGVPWRAADITACRRARVIESEEWMSPRRFLGVLGPAGALGVLIPNQAPEKWTKRAKSLTSEIQEVRNLEADRSPFLRVFGESS